MKRLTLILASMMMLFTLKINAQNARTLLIESFTNTGCGPCAAYNPGLDALIANNPDKVVAIKYHVNWPSGADPMYLHNTADNGARTSYYSVSAVPNAVIDGNRYNGTPAQINQSIINTYQSIESPMELRLTYVVDEGSNTITVNVMGRASTDIEGNLKLYVGVIEKEIHFNSAPGSNGERDFYSVMKKLLPSSSGQTLGTLAANGYFTYSFTWELANIYDMSQLSAIAWVQKTENKEVQQACKASENFEPFYANEAGISNLFNVKSVNCSGTDEPKITLNNFGSNNLTSAELEVTVNGELVKTVSWSGNLATFASETVDLGVINFPVEDENLLEVKIVSANGANDEASDNDIASINITGAPNMVNKTLKLTIRTDANPQETSWTVVDNSTGEIVLEGGPYDTPNHTYTETLTITKTGCYLFTIYDAAGNGLSGSGIYGLKAGSTTLFNGKSFGYSESNEFSYEVTDGLEESLSKPVSVYPNPTSGLLNIVCEGCQNVTLYNMVGQRVFEGVADGWLQIDTKPFGTGVYAVIVGNETKRIVVK